MSDTIFLFFLMVCLTANSRLAWSQKIQWTQVGDRQLSQTMPKTTWADAQKICSLFGASLAVDDNPEVHESLSRFCCQEDGCSDYRGTLSVTISGYTCQEWSAQSPVPHKNYRPESDSTLMKNYCRNPSGFSKGMWCYTPHGIKGRYENCYPTSQCSFDDGTKDYMLWLGVSDQGVPGDWKLADGTPFDLNAGTNYWNNNSPPTSGYTEPNCLLMNWNEIGTWTGESCTSRQAFQCQRPIPEPEPGCSK